MEDRQVAVAVVLVRASLAEREAITRERDREDRRRQCEIIGRQSPLCCGRQGQG